MRLYTIGFTRKDAADFFGKLERAGISQLVDTRLRPSSQLAGFAKQKDLAFFVQRILGRPYRYERLLAPTAELLDAWRRRRIGWDEYERIYLELLERRRIAERLRPEELDGACLLCSEHEPDHCHRRLAAEYLRERWGGIEILHLK